MSEKPLFLAIAEFAHRKGVKSIKDLPACWEAAVGDHWWIAVNGHGVPVACSHGGDVPPFSAFVEFNGWPAGILDPMGGVIAAGELANEQTFRAALEAA